MPAPAAPSPAWRTTTLIVWFACFGKPPRGFLVLPWLFG
jgi:hypothetical protein